MGYANGLLCAVGIWGCLVNSAAGCDMTCHYGKDSDELMAWVVDTCSSGVCSFDIGEKCDAPQCTGGEVRTLLATTPTDCGDAFAFAWQTLRRTCGRQDGICCPDCTGPILQVCDKTPRTGDKQVLTAYTATAAMALVALWLAPGPVCETALPMPSYRNTNLPTNVVGL